MSKIKMQGHTEVWNATIVPDEGETWPVTERFSASTSRVPLCQPTHLHVLYRDGEEQVSATLTGMNVRDDGTPGGMAVSVQVGARHGWARDLIRQFCPELVARARARYDLNRMKG
jgi:hypothetical protein